ncbi:hypothetical protein XthCFBP4691_19295 [Xanthomonas theicola]|uniref:Peptidase C39 domain-containing protein n=1 Tax=Xanthomonas theicola TaxID=56464 RepID=A0A2S6Z7Q0_9XANT|nr:hypothetical protein XthCFBP4691_19295 [Xanthomonas theicola]
MSECGLASLAMVSGWHGKALGLSEMRGRFPLSLKGAKLSHLIHIAQQTRLLLPPRSRFRNCPWRRSTA